MEDNIFGTDVFKGIQKKKDKKVRYSIRMYVKDWHRFLELQKHIIIKLEQDNFTITQAIEEGLNIIKEKYKFPVNTKPLRSGARKNELEVKGSSISAPAEIVELLRSYMNYQVRIQGDLDYTLMKFFEEIIDTLEAKYYAK